MWSIDHGAPSDGTASRGRAARGSSFGGHSNMLRPRAYLGRVPDESHEAINSRVRQAQPDPADVPCLTIAGGGTGKSRPGRQPAVPRLHPVKGACRRARAAKPASAIRSSATNGETVISSGSLQTSQTQANVVISHCHRARQPLPAAAATCCTSQSASRAARPRGTASRYAANTWLATTAAGWSRTIAARSADSQASLWRA